MRPSKIAPEMVGHKFGMLTVLHKDETFKGKPWVKWVCQCSCGNTKSIAAGALRRGDTKSCGCLSRRLTSIRCSEAKTHGLSNHPLYYTWSAMMSRCYNQNNPMYGYYGGRGIDVSKLWHKISNFIKDMHPNWTPHLSLDRVNNDKGYSKSNCRWASKKTQARNRRSSRLISWRGKTKPLAQWCEDLGLDYALVHNRLRYGWDISRVFTEKKRAW